MSEETFDIKKFLKSLVPNNGVWWAKGFSSLWRPVIIIIVGILLYVGFMTAFDRLFPKPKQAATSTTKTRVEAGGTANITNINNPVSDLKQGVYLRGASDRASVGVFKEVLPNIDVSLGAGKDYDEDAFVEVETRFKF